MPLLMSLAIAVWIWGGSTLQALPDFSGQWTVEAAPAPTTPPAGGAPAAPPRGDMGSGWGSPLTIAQDAKQLIVEQTLFSRYDLQPPLRFVYALDGSETRNPVMMGHTTQLRVSRASWDGQTLRITTNYPSIDPASGNAFTTEVTHRLTLESPTTLVIEATRGGALGGRPTQTRTVYRKN
jgi:arylsulfatase